MTRATTDELQTISDLISATKIGILTTVNLDGHLVSRPMSIKDRGFDGDLWFFTEHPSDKTAEIAANAEVNVALDSGKGWLSIAGSAEIVVDPAKIDELWDTAAAAWFVGGREDPKVALLKVTAHTAEYWATNEPKPLLLLKYAKAAVTGGRPNIGESNTVSLDI